jgi:hypothetical protein
MASYTIMIPGAEIRMLRAIKKSNCTLKQAAISAWLLGEKKFTGGKFYYQKKALKLVIQPATSARYC